MIKHNYTEGWLYLNRSGTTVKLLCAIAGVNVQRGKKQKMMVSVINKTGGKVLRVTGWE